MTGLNIDIEDTISDDLRKGLRRAFYRWHVPVQADFDVGLLNPGTATLTDIPGKGVLLEDAAATGDRPRWLMQTAPSPPYTMEAIFHPVLRDTNFISQGVCIRDSATDRFIVLSHGYNSNYVLRPMRWSSKTVFNADNHFFTQISGFNFRINGFRIHDDGTNHTCFFTNNYGGSWLQVGSTVSRTAYLANPDQVGIYHNGILQSGSFTTFKLGMMIRSFRVF